MLIILFPIILPTLPFEYKTLLLPSSLYIIIEALDVFILNEPSLNIFCAISPEGNI